jgi:hypothetical protein
MCKPLFGLGVEGKNMKVQKNSPLYLILSQMNSMLTLVPYFPTFHLNIILPSMLTSSKRSFTYRSSNKMCPFSPVSYVSLIVKLHM